MNFLARRFFSIPREIERDFVRRLRVCDAAALRIRRFASNTLNNPPFSGMPDNHSVIAPKIKLNNLARTFLFGALLKLLDPSGVELILQALLNPFLFGPY